MSSNVPIPSLISVIASVVQSKTVDASLFPKPPSITISTNFSYFSWINSGSVVYSIISSSSWTEVATTGLPKISTIDLAILLSGILIPTVFLFELITSEFY